MALLEGEHPVDRLVHQVDVVAHHQHRAGRRAQEAHHERLGLGVEVVGGLVEHEQVAARQQDPGQLQPSALAAGERADLPEQGLLVEAEPGCDPLRRRLQLVAAAQPEPLLQVAEVADGVHVGGVHLVVQAGHVVPDSGQVAGRQQVVVGQQVGDVVARRRLLRQPGELFGQPHHARGGAELTGQRAQQGRLAGPVGTDQRHLLARRDLERGVVEQDAGARDDPKM